MCIKTTEENYVSGEVAFSATHSFFRVYCPRVLNLKLTL
jgi:hypothetical protein